MNVTTLYGTPLSLYTGRARSYLIKAGIPYRELTFTSTHFRDEVLPKAGGRKSMPTVELDDGTVIRDGAAIIDHFETAAEHPFSPTTPKQRVISCLFDVIGAEGLLRPAMHYRWNFPEENLEFVKFHVKSLMPPGPRRSQQSAAAEDSMREACRGFGVLPGTIELVETLYLELLAKLDAHFTHYPYLFGGRPCIGDFGLIAPLYGHLGRDPKPLSLMQARAIHLYRWVERMNRPEPDVGEFDVQEDAYLTNDHMPDTLVEVLRHIAIDFVPETFAAAACINAWINDQPELMPGTPVKRMLGIGSFEVRAKTITAIAQPYRFFLLKRVQDEFARLDHDSQQDVRTLLEDCDMSEVLSIKLSREIGRSQNLEVWL